MLFWQRDLFDVDRDVISFQDHQKTKRERKRKTKEVDATHLSESLLPWLFPEDYPELQDAIAASMFTWTEEDIVKLCSAVLNDAIYALSSPKCGTELRDMATEWLFRQALVPFSFQHCCIALGVNPERMLAGVFRQVIQRRRELRRSQKLSYKEHVLLQWLECQGWIDEVASMAMTIADDGWEFNPTAIIAHYERQFENSSNYLY
ncbi:hypothetical protein [Aeromonas sp. Y311-2]|uniref:hypothetical protein n=1 Tax=Aeromonas sp. Y311-2 TaxID=2990507 RepID=UPI0022E5AB22|nr:hypothetical protein [Aeromonas sp. Y311-2]